LENLQANLRQNSIENLYDFFNQVFLHIWIKQLLNLLAVKFHTKSFFLLGDMDDYINVPKGKTKPRNLL